MCVLCEPKGKLGQRCETVIHSATHQIIHNCKSQTAEMKLLDLSVMVGYNMAKFSLCGLLQWACYAC